jgi:hypothetical protein
MPSVTAAGRSVIAASRSTTARRIVKCLIGCALTALAAPTQQQPTAPRSIAKRQHSR